MSVAAIIVAGGEGQRFGDSTPKQFLDLAGRPLLLHSVATIGAWAAIDSVVVVLPSEVPDHISNALSDLKVTSLTTGGRTRQASVSEGSMCLPPDADLVMVHDGVRPLVGHDLLERVVGGLTDDIEGVIPVIGIADATKEISSEGKVLSGSSHRLYGAQTPQLMRREPFEDSLARAQAASRDHADCAGMLVAAGYQVGSVPGDPFNLKVTEPQDLRLCEALLAYRGRS